MLTDDSDSATPAWTHLWTESARGAIDLASDDPVAAALRGVWEAQLPWLRRGGTVVDVGSGPAVLPLHLIAHAPAELADVRWLCVDRASFAESTVGVLPPSITLLDGTDFATSAPMGARSQGLVSNFGLEYVDRAAMAAACARWLEPGGQLFAVLHATDSVIDRASVTSAADIACALQEVLLYPRAAALFGALATLPADPAARAGHAVDVREAYNAAVNALKQRMEARGAYSAVLIDMLNGIRDLMAWVREGRLDEAKGELERRETAYGAELVRLRDMQAHAIDVAGLDALLQGLRDAGFVEVGAQQLECPLGPVGWTVSALRG